MPAQTNRPVPVRSRAPGRPDVVDYATAVVAVFVLISAFFLGAVLLAVLLGG